MTVLEVASHLNISYDYVLRQLRQGKLDGSKRKNGEWNVTEDSVARYLFERAEREARKRARSGFGSNGSDSTTSKETHSDTSNEA